MGGLEGLLLADVFPCAVGDFIFFAETSFETWVLDGIVS